MDTSVNPDNKHSHRKLGLAVLVLVLLGLCLGVLGYVTWNWGKDTEAHSVKLISGCQPMFTGANGHGSAQLACSPSYNPEEASLSADEIRAFYDTVTYSLVSGQDGELSNGETITFQADYDQAMAASLGLNIQDTQAVFKVNGLPDSYTRWSDFSEFDRKSIDDLASRALIRYFTDLYGDKVVIDQATLSAKYLSTYEKNKLPYTDLDYIVKVVYTRQISGFFFSTEQTATAYYLINMPGFNPSQSKDYTLDGSEVTVTPISADIDTDQKVRDWYLSLYPNAIDIFS